MQEIAPAHFFFLIDQGFIFIKDPFPQNTCSCQEKPWNVILQL